LAQLAHKLIGALRNSVQTDAESFAAGIDSLTFLGYGDLGKVLAVTRVALQLRFSEKVELTQAERLVLSSIAEGLSTKDIAARTGRSIFTVRAHIANAIARLGCHGRAEAVAVARRRGVIS